MASLESDERNIIEAEDFNWRLVVYPLLGIVAVLVIGLGAYYYHQNQIEQAEDAANTALSTAKTPADMDKVADQFPHTKRAMAGLMMAAQMSFNQKDYDTATKDYQRVMDAKQSPEELRDSAQLGLAATQEATGKADDAIKSYLAVAQKDSRSPFAPVAYHQVAAIYASRQDKTHETDILQQAVRLGGDSTFIKQAADQLKALSPEPAPSAPSTHAAPAP